MCVQLLAFYMPTYIHVSSETWSDTVQLPFHPALGMVRKQLWKGVKTGATDCDWDLIVLVHVLHLSLHIHSKILKFVRERYLMHRGVIFPRVFADLFCIYLKQVGGKAPYRITSILIHDVNKINVLRAQKTFFKSHFLLSMSEKIFFACIVFP